MDIWDEIKKLQGYQSGNGRVDSYGVDHSGFSTRDELEYQSARLARENLLAENFSKQGIAEENYPQFGTNFWGGSPENNYGFGTSNIKQNIENMTNGLNNTGTNIGQGLINQDYTINTKSLISQPSSYFLSNNSVYNNNNTDGLNEYQKAMLKVAQAQAQGSYMSKTMPQNPQRTVYQSLTGFKENQQQWHENNPQQENYNYVQDEYETNQLINDCLKSERYKTFINNIKKPDKEGLGFHISDQPTNSGISQGWYNKFREQNPVIAHNYPTSVQYLTQDQVDNLYCQGFYKPNHIETFNDNHIAEQIFDIGVNIGSSKGIPIIQNAYNDINNKHIGVDGTLGTETISAINNLRDDELLHLNNQIVNRRRSYYDKLPDKSKYPGWYTRAESFRR